MDRIRELSGENFLPICQCMFFFAKLWLWVRAASRISLPNMDSFFLQVVYGCMSSWFFFTVLRGDTTILPFVTRWTILINATNSHVSLKWCSHVLHSSTFCWRKISEIMHTRRYIDSWVIFCFSFIFRIYVGWVYWIRCPIVPFVTSTTNLAFRIYLGSMESVAPA